jgi:pyridoxine 5-phosphate synthase
VELHTGQYCERALEDDAKGVAKEVERLRKAAKLADEMGLEVHAGHGLTYNTVAPVARMPQMVELNIGHFLIGEAIFGGLHSAIRHMRTLMDQARAEPKRPLAAQ